MTVGDSPLEAARSKNEDAVKLSRPSTEASAVNEQQSTLTAIASSAASGEPIETISSSDPSKMGEENHVPEPLVTDAAIGPSSPKDMETATSRRVVTSSRFENDTLPMPEPGIQSM